ncbi:LOW QUALITY PROTEIN: WD repeat-containing protein 25-like [Pecten maximus]|uniref:LOW QUALITY PROTEIN: WD repeat-containing protein 25-like n=1 Tax=Pecten maximus TaxID=6579 RepID=UPI001458D51B|nr:LOW QUALITY PROTEIN: WD repeat-containing protein 25-like [Pecten maximus]
MNALLEYGSGTDDDDDSDEKEDTGEEKRTQPEKVCDFFNFDSVVECDDYQPKTKVLKREFTLSSGLSVEMPVEEFWESVSADDIKLVSERKPSKSCYISKECKAKQTFGNVRGSHETFNNQNRSDLESKMHGVKKEVPTQCMHSHLVRTKALSEIDEQTRIFKHVGEGTLDKQQVYSGQDQVEDKHVRINADNHINHRKLLYLHSKIKPHLNRKMFFKIPNNRNKTLQAISGPVNRVKWNNPMYSHLLMSVSMDGTVKLWNFWSSLDHCVQTVSVHTKAVKDACWSQSGKEIISCGYDKVAIISDVDRGKQLAIFRHENYVNCVKCHPDNTNVFVSGSYNILQAWDKRTPDQPVREFIYKDSTGQVQDVIFSADGSSIFSSCDLLSRDSADRNVMAWDFRSGVVLSNQIYQERYSCTRLKLHPTEGHFLAQTNGDYIAIFSTQKPYKLNKAKRFQGHKGLGYAVGFDVSVEGSLVASGSADGNIYFYNYHTGRLLRTLTTDLDVCTDVALHPVLPSTVACCGWNGHVKVWR